MLARLYLLFLLDLYGLNKKLTIRLVRDVLIYRCAPPIWRYPGRLAIQMFTHHVSDKFPTCTGVYYGCELPMFGDQDPRHQECRFNDTTEAHYFESLNRRPVIRKSN